ncbi:gfo/Idh/MocA family oxidoreductase [Alginatibacterium sediminis]|uniref:Gfo/Idh/MocA family oxidoreductase n=1 Tax=Alginatibacterium sediminis TaxID=2164068 RepID=A0A420EA55_9ALTE|nr:gfo/Idh/MocA family oxidoreductase [Alginatibacterium sediminis]
MLNWGVLAPGRIANNFAQGFAAVSGACLYGVASRDAQRVEEFATRYDIKHTYNSYAQLLEDPAIDVVYIANPHRYHAEVVEQCLNAGKHVLCEKPLTVTAKQATHLFELATEKNLFLMEAVWSRFLPCWQQVKQWIESGNIGEIQLLRSTFGFQAERNMEDRLFNLELAGGAMLDTGVYNIALSEFVMGRQPESVSSSVLVGETGVDERCSVMMDYGDVTSQFSCSFLSKLDNEFQIVGSLGTINVAACFWDATKAELVLNSGDRETFDQAYRASGFEYQIDEVNRCVKAGQTQSDNVSADVTIGNLHVMDQVLSEAGVNYPFAERC